MLPKDGTTIPCSSLCGCAELLPLTLTGCDSGAIFNSSARMTDRSLFRPPTTPLALFALPCLSSPAPELPLLPTPPEDGVEFTVLDKSGLTPAGCICVTGTFEPGTAATVGGTIAGRTTDPSPITTPRSETRASSIARCVIAASLSTAALLDPELPVTATFALRFAPFPTTYQAATA